MGCIYSDLRDGKCQMWEGDSSLDPEGCDEEGFCIAEDDPDPSWCQSFESNEPDEVCDYCGEELGFCALGCETLDPDFEEMD